MEITCDLEGNETVVRFRRWENDINTITGIKKYYFNDSGVEVLVPECGKIPEDCSFYMPDIISVKDFEDAVLELADKIRGGRLGPIVNNNYAGSFITYTPQTTEDKLISIIQKLVEK